ncbi:molybdopterin-dependent oxidoreductase [Kineosporiaceae bacterium SCSIO 59966]|nr:molybdopterin-dependent oxidoreductase [Kineosporiaceae bacterium SCSIO 59966]
MRATAPWPLAAAAGLASGGLALGVAEVLAAVISPATAPLLVVGDAFVDVTPSWLKDVAISAFGTNDKVALFVGMGVVVAALAALAGVVALRRRWAGVAVVALLGVVAVVAATTRPAAGTLDALPSLAGVAVGAVVLVRLVDRLATGADSRRDAQSRTTPAAARRSFLTAVGVTVLAAATGGVVGRLVGRSARDVSATRAALDLPPPARAAATPTDAVTLDVAGITPWQTPNAEFFRIDTALAVPHVDPRDWRLRVHGLVEREVEISFDDLVASDLVEEWITLTCVSNPVGGDLAGNARWLGLPVRELLHRARPDQDADMVLSTSVDGFTASTPLDVLMSSPQALLAVGMNGEPLPLEHGYPVRMVVPGLYGYVSATKWVVDLEVTRFQDATAYWTDRGWAERAPVKTASRIDVPRPSARLEPGPVVVAGVAWAQTRGIERVEVSVDDGPWVAAQLAAQHDVDSWRQWRLEWDATPGSHTLRVRATDGTGETQTAERVDPVPDGASGWHSVTVTVLG